MVDGFFIYYSDKLSTFSQLCWWIKNTFLLRLFRYFFIQFYPHVVRITWHTSVHFRNMVTSHRIRVFLLVQVFYYFINFIIRLCDNSVNKLHALDDDWNLCNWRSLFKLYVCFLVIMAIPQRSNHHFMNRSFYRVSHCSYVSCFYV